VDATGQPRSGAESPSWRPWSLPAGRRAPGRSAAAKTPTPARNCRSPTPTGTASKSSHRPARPDLAALELRHRQRARVEDRIRGAKATGLRNLPFDRWRRNAVWLELVLMACDLCRWTQALLLGRRARGLRTQGAALPAAARRRPHQPPRPPPDRASAAPGRGRTPWPPRSSACGHCRCAAEAAPIPPRTRPGRPGWLAYPRRPRPGPGDPPHRTTITLHQPTPSPVDGDRTAANPPMHPRPTPPAPHEKPRLASAFHGVGIAMCGLRAVNLVSWRNVACRWSQSAAECTLWVRHRNVVLW
jgi:hypothetical protein